MNLAGKSRRSCGLAVVISQDATKSGSASDTTCGSSALGSRINDPGPDALVGSLVVVVVDVGSNDGADDGLVQVDESVGAFLLEGADAALDVGVAVGTAGWGLVAGDAGIGQDRYEAGQPESAIAIVDEVGDAVAGEESGIGHGQFPGDLLHGGGVGMDGDGGDVQFTCGESHDQQDPDPHQVGRRGDGYAGEVAGRQGAPVRGDARPPGAGSAPAFTRRRDMVLRQDIADRLVADGDATVGQRITDAVIAPGRVVSGQLHDQLPDAGGDGRPSASTAAPR